MPDNAGGARREALHCPKPGLAVKAAEDVDAVVEKDRRQAGARARHGRHDLPAPRLRVVHLDRTQDILKIRLF